MTSDAVVPARPAGSDWFLRSHLKVRHLRIVATLGDTHSIGRTAQQLHSTQPAISKAVAELERAAGTQLFERRARGTWPTAAGAVLVRHAREIFGSLARAGEELSVLTAGLSGLLAVGCNFSSAAWLVPRALLELRQVAPQLAVSVREGLLEGLLSELRASRVDVVVARRPALLDPKLFVSHELFEEPMSIVCSPAHPLARRRRLAWADLARWPWVMPATDATSPVRAGLNQVLHAQGVQPLDTGIECSSILANHLLLRELEALTLAPSLVARLHADAGLLAVLPLKLPRVFGTITVITLQGRDTAPAVDLFRECLLRIRPD